MSDESNQPGEGGRTYPVPGRADLAMAGARTLIAAIPIAGGPINELLSFLLTPAVSRRRDDWFRALADDLVRLSETVEGFNLEDLSSNETFVSATIQATRIALGTHRKEKLKYLRNGLLRVACDPSGYDEVSEIMFRCIDDLGLIHVKILALLDNDELIERKRAGVMDQDGFDYGRYIDEALSSAARRYIGSLLPVIVSDLHVHGLSNVSSVWHQFRGEKVVTVFGKRFLEFVSDYDTESNKA